MEGVCILRSFSALGSSATCNSVYRRRRPRRRPLSNQGKRTNPPWTINPPDKIPFPMSILRQNPPLLPTMTDGWNIIHLPVSCFMRNHNAKQLRVDFNSTPNTVTSCGLSPEGELCRGLAVSRGRCCWRWASVAVINRRRRPRHFAHRELSPAIT